MQSESSIRAAASELDEALEAGDLDRGLSPVSQKTARSSCSVCVSTGMQECADGSTGCSPTSTRIEFSPRVISVDGDVFIEEFGVTGILANGRRLESQWAEMLTYRDDLVTSLRLYFNPVDFAPASGVIGRVAGPAAARLARRGLEPFEPIHDTE